MRMNKKRIAWCGGIIPSPHHFHQKYEWTVQPTNRGSEPNSIPFPLHFHAHTCLHYVIIAKHPLIKKFPDRFLWENWQNEEPEERKDSSISYFRSMNYNTETL